jgi:hypothetical protein
VISREGGKQHKTKRRREERKEEERVRREEEKTTKEGAGLGAWLGWGAPVAFST